jgi:hypothetical protein
MSAFAAAVGALFADPNMGRDAVYIADGGAPILVAAVRSRGCRSMMWPKLPPMLTAAKSNVWGTG